jgi:hypothetical protein
MTVRFNPAMCLKALLLVGAGALLTAQTTVTQPTTAAKRPVGFTGTDKQNEGGFMRTPFIDHKSMRKDRCDETPRPKDCNVKF